MVLIFRYLEVSVESAGRCDNRVCVTRAVVTGVENIWEASKSHSAQNQFRMPPQQDHGTSSCKTRHFPPMSS